MNGSTVVGRSGPCARPYAATVPPQEVWARTFASVVLPTPSIAPAKRWDCSGRPGSSESSRRSITSAAPSSRRYSAFSCERPVEAITRCPRPASSATAIEPAPPEAPVTSTSPDSGVTPVSSRRSTASIAVNPAVPIAAARSGERPAGRRTSASARTRARVAKPP